MSHYLHTQLAQPIKLQAGLQMQGEYHVRESVLNIVCVFIAQPCYAMQIYGNDFSYIHQAHLHFLLHL